MVHVDGKMLRIRDTLIFRDMQGNELVKIQERIARIKDTMRAFCSGRDIHRCLVSMPSDGLGNSGK